MHRYKLQCVSAIRSSIQKSSLCYCDLLVIWELLDVFAARALVAGSHSRCFPRAFSVKLLSSSLVPVRAGA